MPSDAVIDHFIDKVGPEFLFCIGMLAILAFVAVKAIPITKELKMKKLDRDAEIAMKNLQIKEMQEQRMAEDAVREDARDRARTDVIGKQNEIQKNLARTIEGQSIQMAALIASLDESKERSRAVGDTVNDTNHMVSEIHTMIVKQRHNYWSDSK